MEKLCIMFKVKEIIKKRTESEEKAERRICWRPAAVLIAAFTVELMGGKDSEDALL